MQSFWHRIPVGSLFENNGFYKPRHTLWWHMGSVGGGRVPVGVNTADSDFNTVEKTGGKKTERHEFKVGYKGYTVLLWVVMTI